MIKTLPLLTATVLFVAAGYWHGVWTDRWAPSYDAQAAVDRFDQIPRSVGDWIGSEVNTRPSDLGWNEQVGFLRRYTHRVSGESVVVALWHGPTGYIGVHTPMTCYPRLGYSSPPQPVMDDSLSGAASGRRAEFAVAQFSKTSADVPSHLRFWWAWSATGDWLAPESPRLAFSSHRALYKLYVVQDMVLADGTSQGDPCPVFLKTFLPELNKALFDVQ
jgi:hypothetical protein